jgi:hypothetical protein
MNTITRNELNQRGWYCPTCGHELIVAGGPNAPEIVACTNTECDSAVLTIIEEG